MLPTNVKQRVLNDRLISFQNGEKISLKNRSQEATNRRNNVTANYGYRPAAAVITLTNNQPQNQNQYQYHPNQRGCAQCNSLIHRVKRLQQENRLLKQKEIENTGQLRKMDTICNQIAKTKQRIALKLLSKHEELANILGPNSGFTTTRSQANQQRIVRAKAYLDSAGRVPDLEQMRRLVLKSLQTLKELDPL